MLGVVHEEGLLFLILFFQKTIMMNDLVANIMNLKHPFDQPIFQHVSVVLDALLKSISIYIFLKMLF